jgi:hypothetical protein
MIENFNHLSKRKPTMEESTVGLITTDYLPYLPSLALTRAGSMGIISAVWHPRHE